MMAVLRLLRLGQSILATVDTQAARNSRGAGGGVFGSIGKGAGAGRAAPGSAGRRAGVVPDSGAGALGVLEHPSSSAARPAATPADKVRRFFASKTKTTLRIS